MSKGPIDNNPTLLQIIAIIWNHDDIYELLGVDEIIQNIITDETIWIKHVLTTTMLSFISVGKIGNSNTICVHFNERS